MHYTALQLARLAGCGDPDAVDSPGADFLQGIADSVREAVAYNDGAVPEDWRETADGSVPVYTRRMWEVFVDLAAYQEDPSELGVDADDMTRCAEACLYIIAGRLCSALAEAITEAGE